MPGHLDAQVEHERAVVILRHWTHNPGTVVVKDVVATVSCCIVLGAQRLLIHSAVSDKASGLM